MAAELFRTTDHGDYMLYVDVEHKQAIRGIERYRAWKVAAMYQKNEQLTAIQYRVPHDDYAKARRIEKRINFA